MQTDIQKIITSNGKCLILTAVSLSEIPIPNSTAQTVEDAFKELSPFIKDPKQVIYIRDLPSKTIDGKYPGGNCLNRHEAMIALVDWNTSEQQLVSTVNHELHHMARWQNAGYGKTLGGAIMSEGFATYYEETRSGWTPPWSQTKLNKVMIGTAVERWDDEHHDHADWFFNGKHGKWVGYSIGYNLAKNIYADGFDLKDSLTIKPTSEVKSILKNLV